MSPPLSEIKAKSDGVFFGVYKGVDLPLWTWRLGAIEQ
jgi:hypothetical protein